MNPYTPHLFLAETTGEMLIQFVILAIIVVSMINKVRKKNDQQKPRAPRSDSSRPTESMTIEEQAARRRRRMKELARKQQQSERAVQSRGATDPANLTMAQRVQRARAKAMYEERARQLKQQPTEPTTRQPDTPPAPTPRRARPTSTAKPRTATRPSLSPAAAEAEHEQNIVHRHVPDAPKPAARIARHFQLGRVTNQTLRNAVILKEILDTPVALRETGAAPLTPWPKTTERS